jgi:hypothetical protein
VVFGDPLPGSSKRPTAWLALQEGALIVAVQIPTDPDRGLLERARPQPDGNPAVLLDDAIEIWLADSARSPKRLYRFVVSALGTSWGGAYQGDGRTWQLQDGWRSRATATGRVESDVWRIELRIPSVAELLSGSENPGFTVAYKARRGAAAVRWPSSADPTDPARALASLALEREGGKPEVVEVPPSAAAKSPACEHLWQEGARGAVLAVGFYPSYAKLRVHLDVRRVPWVAKIESASLRVRRRTDGLELIETPLTVGSAGPTVLEKLVELPQLKPGTYDAQAILTPTGCTAVEGPSRSFVHGVFGWEGNTLGESDDVIPPFTPLTIAGRHVAVVGRDHVMNDVGLFDQVESAGEPILKGPATFRVTIAGREEHPLPLHPIELTSEAPGRVRFTADWQAGPLRARINGHYEMDGLVRMDMALSGNAALRLDRLDLVLPFRSDQASLMNAVTDDALHHRLGAVPSGNGTVWDSTRVGRTDLPPEFVPYLWLGTEERGLSWMAESTRDWLLAPGVPTQEISRGPASVDLVVHFVTKPSPVGHARKLSFALQGTPAKPRPEVPRPWRTWQVVCAAPNPVYRLCPLASGSYWGSETPYGNVYPRGRDEFVFDLIATARQSGHADPAAADAWLKDHTIPESDRGWAQAGLRWSLDAASQRPDAIVAYVNAHKAAWTPEFEVYADEWRSVPFGERAGADENADHELLMTPTRSWQDFALFYLDRMLASGAVDGFFLDNTYLRANFDADFGQAYRDDEGVLHPGVDLFSLREFLRRAQVLAWQRRRAWLDVGHMTTTPVAAVQVWSGASLDGEWKYGLADYQDRFPRDLLRAGSLGAQAGTVPVYLPGLVGQPAPDERTRLERSLAGVTAVHEIRVMAPLDGPLGTVWKSLYDFGYGRTSCLVRRYWDPQRGFELRGADAEALVVACEGQALALVVSFGDTADAELQLDPAALGLRPGGRCFDVEGSGASAPVTLQTGCRFSLVRHGFRLIGYRS